MLGSARRTSTIERVGCARRSGLQRAPGENFWRPLRELLGTRRSRCAECNGVTFREGELRKEWSSIHQEKNRSPITYVLESA